MEYANEMGGGGGGICKTLLEGFLLRKLPMKETEYFSQKRSCTYYFGGVEGEGGGGGKVSFKDRTSGFFEEMF